MNLKNLSATIKIPKLLKNKLNNKRIKQIYSKFEKSLNINENFVVAVSGGPDSLALAFLAKIYSIKHKLIAKFFIIDHKLRKESTNEARSVKKILDQHLISSEILSWKGKKPSKNIQSLARNERYKLLFKKADKLKINNILIGHHQDDLFENFFIRMIRGSGLKGLVSLDKKNIIEKKNLLRPLLDQKKNDLIFVSQKVFNFYVEDPSNKDEKYLRIKVRNLIEELKMNGLDRKKFFKTINNLKQSNTIVESYVNKNIRKNTFFSEKMNRLILNKQFFQKPYEITFRSLSESIKLIGNKYYSVRGKKLNKLINDVNKDGLFRVTLGGCIVEKVNQTVIITKEH